MILKLKNKQCEPTELEIKELVQEAINSSKYCHDYNLLRLEYFYDKRSNNYCINTLVYNGKVSVMSTFRGKYPYGAVSNCVFGIVPDIVKTEHSLKIA